MFHDLAIDLLIARHDELEHHEISEQNIRRNFCNFSAFLGAFLSSIPLDANRARFLVIVFEELIGFFHLAICKRIHGIYDDRSGAGAWILFFFF